MNLAPFGYDHLYRWLEDSPLAHWLESVPSQVEDKLVSHGDMPRWLGALTQLPELRPDSLDLTDSCLRIGSSATTCIV